MSVLFRANTDVIVKGMRMPSGCAECPIAEDYEGVDFCRVMPRIMYKVREFNAAVEAGTKPEWCPLVEVPTPHGRLIDADRLLDDGADICAEIDDGDGYVRSVFGYSHDAINAAPTIIEVEGDGD